MAITLNKTTGLSHTRLPGDIMKGSKAIALKKLPGYNTKGYPTTLLKDPRL